MLKFSNQILPVLLVHDTSSFNTYLVRTMNSKKICAELFMGISGETCNEDKIGVVLPSSFDDKDWNELIFEEKALGPPEYSQWESRN